MNENSETHVIFGIGPLGQSVMHALLKRGKKIKMVNRSGKPFEGLPPGVEIVAGDAYQPEFTRNVCSGATAVYQCAQPAYNQWPALFPPLQASILEGTAYAGAKFVVADNLYCYGEVQGPIHEGLPYNAHTRKGTTRAKMATSVLEAHQNGKVRAVLARGSDFYGPAVLASALGEMAILPALKGKSASLVGNLNIPHTYTYIQDFGEALVTLGEHDEALGQVWHVPNPPTLTQKELMTLFFEEMNLPPKINRMGRMVVMIGALFMPAARESLEMIYEFEKPFVVDSSKYVRSFGDHATPHRQAIRATLDWYRTKLA